MLVGHVRAPGHNAPLIRFLILALYSLLVYILCFPTFIWVSASVSVFYMSVNISVSFPTYTPFSLFPYLFLPYLSFPLKVDSIHYKAGCHKRRLNVALVFLCLFRVVVHLFWLVNVCFFVVLSFSIPSQEIGLGIHFWNDLFCFEWGVKPQLSQHFTLM